MKWIDFWYPLIPDRSLLPKVPQLAEKRHREFFSSIDFDPAFVAYKIDLGAHVVDRETFLSMWKDYRDKSTPCWSTNRLDNQQVTWILQRKPQ